MVEHLTDGFELDSLSTSLPADMPLPLCSRDLVRYLPVRPAGSPCRRLLLYTDGSFCASLSKSSFAVAVFADEADHAWHWAGFVADSLPCQGEYGAPSAFEAELFGLAVSFLIALRAKPVEVTCIYDAQSAAAVAHCMANTACCDSQSVSGLPGYGRYDHLYAHPQSSGQRRQ